MPVATPASLANTHSISGDSATRELIVSRVFAAPPDLLFRLWTDPEHISSWWGPHGFTTTTHHHDLRPGGLWRFTMHAPNGQSFSNTIVYTEITAPDRLVYTHHRGDDPASPPHFYATVTFEPTGNNTTRVTLRSVFPTLEEYNYALSVGAVEGGRQTLERFSRQAEDIQIHAGLYALSISRIFKAPRDLVFEAFTNHEHRKQWIGPRAFKATHFEQDLRPGGKWRSCIRQVAEWNGHIDIPDLWQGGVYHEIVPPERLVYTFAWEGQGQPTRETLITIHFIALDDHRTQMDFHQTFFDDVSLRDGHNQGWNSAFDCLNEYVQTKLAATNNT